MISEIYTIYDSVAEEGGPLFLAKNVLTAKRSAQQLLSTIDQSCRSDYKLLYLGTYDSESCIIDSGTKQEFNIDIATKSDLSLVGEDNE
nr:MAG: nonstructural protein [Microviridae sp.]